MNPLVTVGIPTYNRPEGLKRTLEQITAQTYQNIEIIISDNCSPKEEVKKVAEEFIKKDSRIKYYKQQSNIGITPNFKFVLEKSTGEYFMWASDDDEWHPTFIETCLKHIGNAGLVMQSHYKTIYWSTGKINESKGPFLTTSNSTFENIILFYQNNQPSLIYGLFKKETIAPYLGIKNMDLIDVFLLTRHILHYGVNTFPEQLYVQGIENPEYTIKPIKKYTKQNFRYIPRFYYTVKEIFKCKSLSFGQKIIVSKVVFVNVLNNFINFEKNTRPFNTKLVLFFLKSFIYINNFLCKITGSKNYNISPLVINHSA